MRNPDDQLRRHEKWLQHFLKEQKIELPVIGAIVFTYPSSVIQSRSGNRILIQSLGLPYLIEKTLIKFPETILTAKKTKLLAQKLVDFHSVKPSKSILLPTGFIKGVLCPNCIGHQIHYHFKKWSCSSCSFVDSSSHLRALERYRRLINSTISSREFREFTGIDSVSIASKLLTASKMTYRGSFKDRVYVIPESFYDGDSISGVPDSIF